jgi:tetratricopeptide (TPR) repeat protein
MKSGIAEFESAIGEFTKALALDPNCSVSYLKRGLCYYNLGKMEDSYKDFNKAIDLNPRDSEAYYHRAVVRKMLKDSKGCCDDLNTSVLMGNERASQLMKTLCVN